MTSIETEPLKLLNSTYTLATFKNGKDYILRIDQCLCDIDPYTCEKLLKPDQLWHYGVIIDNISIDKLSIIAYLTKKLGKNLMPIF